MIRLYFNHFDRAVLPGDAWFRIRFFHCACLQKLCGESGRVTGIGVYFGKHLFCISRHSPKHCPFPF